MHTDKIHINADETRPLLYSDPSSTVKKNSNEFQTSAISGRNTDNQSQEPTPAKCMKNSLLIALIYLLVFTGYSSLSNLESSLSLVGVEALSVAGVASVFGCYMSPLILAMVRPKAAIATAWFCMSLFIAANFYPTQYTLFPACVMYGFATGSAWTAQLSYTTNTAITYAKLTGKLEANTIALSNGIFFLAYASAQVGGNTISSLVLGRTDTYAIPPLPAFSFSNSSFDDNSTSMLLIQDNDNTTLQCGVHYCPVSNNDVTSEGPPQQTVNTLLGIFLGCVGLGFLVSVFLLDPLSRFIPEECKIREPKDAQSLLLSPLKQLKNPGMLLLLPVLVYSGMQQIVMFAQYTKAFVSCAVGVHYVGYVMTCMGLCSAVTSLLAGVLALYVGRVTLCLSGFVIQLGLHLHLMMWTEFDIYSLFVTSGAWGVSDGLLHTQLSALIGVMFQENQDAAFAIFRMLSSLGFAITYGYSALLCFIMYLRKDRPYDPGSHSTLYDMTSPFLFNALSGN
ncbi:protein unc-93 homolog A-like [Liolophura sinensis]|uniref:protein unc-93 homolog A-like n=1 Tax=Liolophura sinensis TaxID=3198878 RepID=UPI00315976E8